MICQLFFQLRNAGLRGGGGVLAPLRVALGARELHAKQRGRLDEMRGVVRC